MAAQLDDVPLLTVLASLPPGFPAAVFPIRAHWHAELEHDPQLSLPIWSNDAYELLFPPMTPTYLDAAPKSPTRHFIRSILSPDSVDIWTTCLRTISTPDFSLHAHTDVKSPNAAAQALSLRLAAGGLLSLSVQLVDSRYIIVIGAVTPEGTSSCESCERPSGKAVVRRAENRSHNVQPTPVCPSYFLNSMRVAHF